MRERERGEEREHKQWGGVDGEADSVLIREPNMGFHPRTLG